MEKGGPKTSEKFGIGVSVRDLPSNVLAGSEDSHADIADIYEETETANSSEESDSEGENTSTHETVSAELQTTLQVELTLWKI